MSDGKEKPGFERLELGAGSIIFKEGDPGGEIFLIEHGKVEVSMQGKFGKRVAISLLERGDLLGEMALISGEPRMATATALSSATLLVISRANFEARLARMDPVMERMMKALTYKLKTLSERHVEEMVKFR